jgi:hypothetical protein
MVHRNVGLARVDGGDNHWRSTIPGLHRRLSEGSRGVQCLRLSRD